MSHHTEEELLSLLMESNEPAFNEIYNRFWHRLYSRALRKTNDALDSEEIVQEIFVALWKRRAEAGSILNLNNYLATSVKYGIMKLFAKQTLLDKHQSAYASSLVPFENPTERWLDAAELRQQLNEAVVQLPERCRMVFHLSREEGQSHKKIAQHLNISEKAVEKQITKALKSLRLSLSELYTRMLF